MSNALRVAWLVNLKLHGHVPAIGRIGSLWVFLSKQNKETMESLHEG